MTDFDRVIAETANLDANEDTCRENAIYWITGDKYCTVQAHQTKYRNRIIELSEKYPDEVRIKSDRFGVMVATLPLKAIKINIMERKMTDDQKEELVNRLREYRSTTNGME